MHFTRVLLLAFGASTLASPHHSSRQERNYNETFDCSQEENSSSLAPIGTAAPPPPPAVPSESSGASASAPAQSPVELAAQSPPASSSAAAPTSSSPATFGTSTSSGSGATVPASFTQYGAGDSSGSQNCNTATAACGFYDNPGFNAAVSQNLYGVGPGAGAGPTCGLCYKLTALTNPYNNNAPLSAAGTSIVVKVNNLCPIEGNPLCSQPTLSDKNSLGANVNFDLCKDDGAAAALLGPSGAGAAMGTAEQVSCDQWTGSGTITS